MKTTSFVQAAVFTLLFTALTVSGGCVALVAGGAGAGGVGYVQGELTSEESTSMNRLWAAALKGVKSKKMYVVKKTRNTSEAEIIARNSHDEKVTIKLKPLGKNKSELRIRVGLFGDEKYSLALRDRIRRYI